ncbi:Cysteine--tRNA ligase [Bienertia sinuspersici]
MGLRRIPWGGLLLCWVFCILCFKALSDVPDFSVKFLQVPAQFSHLNSATFIFEALVANTTQKCSNCSFNCKLDDGKFSDCGGRNVSFVGLKDGNHSMQVCANSTQGVGCATHNWTIDTVHPTANISASTSFTIANNVTLLVYGAGQVMPNTLKTIEPNLKYSIVVSLSTDVEYGRAILVMDRGFCTDNAGNHFIRPSNSSFIVHFDRRRVSVSLRIHVPEKLLQLGGDTRTVQATNSFKNLKVYLYFSEPVLNTSAEVMSSINTTMGMLRPINGSSLTNRRFGYMIENIPNTSIITVNLNSRLVISRQGSTVSPVAPATFLYDSKRPAVRLSTTSKMRTRESSVTVSIKFLKPVFGFNSSHLVVSGELTKNVYIALIQAYEGIMSISIPENITADVAGNPNLASNHLHLRHSTCLVAGLLTISTASLQSAGAYPRSSSSLTTDPTKNLFRIACYIQIFAFSRWLAVTLPVEYYEFTRGIQWSVPYLYLPWESDHSQPMGFSPNTSISSHFSKNGFSSIAQTDPFKKGNLNNKAGVIYGAPLTAMEYQSFFESQHIIPEAQFIKTSESSTRWMDFKRTMFWLAVIGGSLILVHLFLLLVLKLRMNGSRVKTYGNSTLGTIIGVLLLILTSSLQLALFVFLSYGITLGWLLQYKEVHQVGRKYHWYQELVRVTLGPGKRGQWTWRNETNSVYLAKFGPLFEDLRGPPKYMLSMITGGTHMPVDRIIASEDENEDAEAPFIQKIFGILRIYYTFLESIKRFLLGVLAGLHSGNSISKSPTTILLCITSFQLFFLVLKKPYIKKKVQLVEIISIACEVGIFATCLTLLDREFSTQAETGIGYFMLSLFLLGFLALMSNEWFALYEQTRRLDTSKKSFLVGLRTAFVGLFLLFVPQKLMKSVANWLPEDKMARDNKKISRLNSTNAGDQRSSSSSTADNKPWSKQLREMAKASFREGKSNSGYEPSSNSRWSEFWREKLSWSSSSRTTSSDSKSRPKSLYKDMENIFASR